MRILVGDCGSAIARSNRLSFIVMIQQKAESCPFIIKAPDSGHIERMLACSEIWTLDGQDGMSVQGNSPEHERKAEL